MEDRLKAMVEKRRVAAMQKALNDAENARRLAVAEIVEAKEQLRVKTAARTGSSSTARLQFMRAGGAVMSVKEDLVGLLKEVRKAFKRELYEVKSIEESADRLRAREGKEDDDVDLVGNDTPS